MSQESSTGRTHRFDIVDALGVVGPWRDRPPGTAYEFEDLLEEHERFGIARRLVLHAEARDGVPAEGNNSLTRMAFLREDTGTIWTALPPRRFGGNPAARMIADAKADGVAMFAMFPDTHGHHLAPWANGDLYRAMETVRLPLLLDVGNLMGAEARRRYEEIHEVAAAHPHLPIVLWNAFYMDERLLIPLLDLCPNVHLGIATVFIPTWGIEQFTERYGPGRLIFGSNWPRQSPGPLLTYVLYADIPVRSKIMILGGNVERLLSAVRWSVRGFKKPDAAVAADADADADGSDLSGDAAADATPIGDDLHDPTAPWLKALADLKAGVMDPDE